MQRLFEIFLVIFVLFFIIFFILYKTYFSGFCLDIAENKKLKSIAFCKDSYICEISKTKINSINVLESWQCNKKQIKIFEFNYYKDEAFKIINNINK